MHLDIHPNARSDILALRAKDQDAAAVIVVLLEQLQSDPNVVDLLTTKGDSNAHGEKLNVKPWVTAKSERNLWRLRVLETPATEYRVFYGYHWQTRQMCVLGVAHKSDIDYDDHSSGFAARVLADWKATCS